MQNNPMGDISMRDRQWDRELEIYMQDRLEEKDILLMTHLVLGYPSFSENRRLVSVMVEAGVDLIELQIPCPNPKADGPVIAQANRAALASGISINECIVYAQSLADEFDIPFFLVCYNDTLIQHGLERFVLDLADANLCGAIVPDLPSQLIEAYCDAMHGRRLVPIMFFFQGMPETRMRKLAPLGKGFVYCVARKGVTGEKTEFGMELTGYLERCRRSCPLPLAVGFGVQQKADIDFLKGKAEIAVMGTQIMRLMGEGEIETVEKFIIGLK